MRQSLGSLAAKSVKPVKPKGNAGDAKAAKCYLTISPWLSNPCDGTEETEK